MNSTLYIRPLFKDDWKSVVKIYKEGINTNIATFETEVPTWKKWKKSHVLSCSLVIEVADEIVGFASLSQLSKRNVYKGVAEVSIYILDRYKNKGLGAKLLNALVNQSEEQHYWSLQASIFSENLASINLHKKCGFRVVGVREKIGRLNNVWHNNTLMERRSELVFR